MIAWLSFRFIPEKIGCGKTKYYRIIVATRNVIRYYRSYIYNYVDLIFVVCVLTVTNPQRTVRCISLVQ